MRVFAVIRLSEPVKVEAAVKQHFDKHSLKLSDQEWLVAGKGTAKEVSDQLGISEGENGIGIVFRTEGYFGRAPSDIWEWIKTKTEEANG